jgi:hypothetical protein
MGKKGSWTGQCQLTKIEVNWEDTFTYEWGKTRDDAKKVPAISVRLGLTARLDNGQPHTYATKRQYWVLGDPATVLPDAPIAKFPDKYRAAAKDQMGVIMGWFQGILGTTSSDPIIRDPGSAVQAIDGMIQSAQAGGSAIIVEAGWSKDIETFEYKKGDKAGQKGSRETINDYVYKNHSLGTETPAGQPA